MRIATLVLTLTVACLPALGDVPVLAPLPRGAWNARAAAHLLERAGFGGTPAEIQRLAGLSPEQAVASLFGTPGTPAGPPLRLTPAQDSPEIQRRIYAELQRQLRVLRRQQPNLPERGLEAQAQPRAVGAVYYRLRRAYQQQLLTWWLTRMVRARHPLQEKLVLFWHGHFATELNTVGSVTLMKIQNALFRRHAAGSFRQLLIGVARDPAMLRYLDGFRNLKRHPNENFARELMELFTLGRGHYTEGDVKEAARAFTGWSMAGARFQFLAYQHDYGVKKFLGRTGRFDGGDIIRILLEQPATALRLADKLCRFFLADDVPAPVVFAVAQALREQDYRIRPVLEKLFTSRLFYDARFVGRKIKSPVELAVGTIRKLGLPADAIPLALPFVNRMGQALLNPPNVKGWDGGRAWINSATLLARYNLMYDLVRSGQQLAARRRRSDPLAPGYSWSASEMLKLPVLAELDRCKSARQVVEELAARLLGGRLTKARRAQLEAMLFTPERLFDASRPETRMRTLFVMVLMTATPEYQLH